MIRLRNVHGHAVDLPDDVRFVELLDLTGKIGQVLILRNSGEIQTMTNRDVEEVRRYERAFGVKFCPLIQVPDNAVPSFD